MADDIIDYDLLGEPIYKTESLRDKWREPPFTTLNTATGIWRNRKKKSREMRIRSDVGRDSNLMGAMYLEELSQQVDSLRLFSIFVRSIQ